MFPRRSVIPNMSPWFALTGLSTDVNVQCGYNFMNLATWKVIQRRSWTELTTPIHIIQRAESKARAELKITVDTDPPNQLIFRRADKSILEDEPFILKIRMKERIVMVTKIMIASLHHHHKRKKRRMRERIMMITKMTIVSLHHHHKRKKRHFHHKIQT